MSTCTGCGAESPPGFAFCPRCGNRLPRACLACGSECGTDFAFCPRCGVALGPRPTAAAETPAATSREADRRQVTVLFADLSGFTRMAERLDPEVVRAFQNALFETFAQAVTRYDGFVEKFVGANIECAEGLAGIGKFPSDEEILTAARSLRR